MKKLLVLCVVLATTASLGFTQAAPSDPALAARSQEVQAKMRKVDILLQTMPLLLKKSQYNDLLPVLERARTDMRKVLDLEDQEIVKLEADLDAALKAAYEKSDFPNRELLVRCYRLTGALAQTRLIARQAISNQVLDAVKKIFDAGQSKLAANMLDWKAIDPSANLEGKSEDEKLLFYIRQVLLDPLAYPVLIELSKRAPE